MSRFFVLSPADCAGRRARPLLDGTSTSPMLAEVRRASGVPLGSLFSMLSPLYFRGKLAYARRFADDADRIRVITPSRGLLAPETPVDRSLLDEFANTPVSNDSPGYRRALLATARAEDSQASPAQVVFLGSVATTKYVEPLLEVWGRRLVFPAPFVGLGSLSRGSLLLRTVDAGTELVYVPAGSTPRSSVSSSPSLYSAGP